jgi:pyridoxal phosphate enzyme (YggS family)
MQSLPERIADIQNQIAAAAKRAGRSPAAIQLIGVSKTHPPEMISAALAAGLRHFGENRVQEAENKITALNEQRSAITWHLIGHLQTNKASRAAALFDMIHSVDSLRLANALNRHRSGAPLPILLQVNVSGEASKEGFDLADWPSNTANWSTFVGDVAQILALPNLQVAGLMTIAPWGSDPEQARPTFVRTRLLRDQLAQQFPDSTWNELSMGMTDDFAVAIEEGSTMVRIGRALFGLRT